MLGDLGKLIVAKGFKKLPKIQKIARSGHTDWHLNQLLITASCAAFDLISAKALEGAFVNFQLCQQLFNKPLRAECHEQNLA